MAELTEKDYDALDEDFTNNPPKIDPNKKGTGYFSQQKRAGRTITVDKLSADYLITKAEAAHTTPARIIGDLVREKIAASV
ncbi:MAG: hypothetical protein Ta2B_22970 [Termitinemataceae bacterium]|nr:MAG: hypothetical protein Ta2B_22970 [Termitinemataceae bacterium]